MSITGLPGQGPVRVGIPDRRPHRRHLLRHGHPDRAARARGIRRGPVGRTPRCCRRRSRCSISRPRAGSIAKRGAGPGRQQPSDQHPDRRLQDQGRPHQHRRRRRRDVSAASARRSARPNLGADPDYRHRQGPRSRTATSSTRRSRRSPRRKTSADWIDAAQQGRRARADRSTAWTRSSPIRRCSISASPKPVDHPTLGRIDLVGQAVTLSRTPSRLHSADARARRAHRRGAARTRL